MTVPNEINWKSHDGDGLTVSFTTSFTFESNDEVSVTHISSTGVETSWTEGTQYTLTGAGTGSAGTIAVETSPTDYTPASGEKLIVELDPDITQDTPLPRGGIVSPKTTLEPMFDLLTRQILNVKRDADRSMRAPITESSLGRLPEVADRKGKFLYFDDDDGSPSAVAAASEDVSDIAQSVTDAQDAQTAAETAQTAAEAAQTAAETAQETLKGINTQTGTTYTLVLADAGKVVEMDNSSANTLTVPPNSSVAFALNTVIQIVQHGTGTTTIAAGAGVTINSAGSMLDIASQFGGAMLYKRGTDEWTLIGDLA